MGSTSVEHETARRLAVDIVAALGPAWSWNSVNIDSTGGGYTVAALSFVYERRHSQSGGPLSCTVVVAAYDDAPTAATFEEFAKDGAEIQIGVYDGSEWMAGGYPFDDEIGRGFVPLLEDPATSVAVFVAEYLQEWAEWVAAGRPLS